MSAVDPVTALLADLDRPARPPVEFAEPLLARLLVELGGSAPARLDRDRFGWFLPRVPRWLRVAVVAGLAVLLLAAVATATYLAVRPSVESPPPKSARLTILGATYGGNGSATISAIEPSGRLRTLWRCPGNGFCGNLTSVAWAPDGKHLAFTLDEIHEISPYIGLHIVDLATGTDLHIPNLPLPPTLPQPRAVFGKLARQAIRRLGCMFPDDLAWSPNGRRLAYSCSSDGPVVRRRIFIINSNGSQRALVPTGVRRAFWPSWSRGGTRIAFATARKPIERIQADTNDPVTIIHSSIYTVRLDGSQRRRLATDATAPDWSPDGTAIAYQSGCGGIGLVTPSGYDLVTPLAKAGVCSVIGPPGRPVWAPDGSQIAIAPANGIGVYLMDADGTNLELVTTEAGTGIFDSGRPAWAPRTASMRKLQQGLEAPVCRTCR
jgi:hypothetical protein